MNLKIITIFCLGSSLLLGLFTFTSCSKSGVKPGNQTNNTGGDSVAHIKGWQQVASLPSPRAYATAFTLNGNGYVAGGVSNIGDPHAPGYDDMYMYDATANKWVKKSGMPALDIIRGGRWYPFTFIINNTVYGGGGLSLNGVPGNDINAYDPVKDQWNLVAKWNGMYAFDRSSAAEYGGKGFIFSFPQANESVYEFDPVAKTIKVAPFVGHMPSGLWSIDDWYGTDGTNLIWGRTGATDYMATIDTAKFLMNYYPQLQNPAQCPSQFSVIRKGLYYNGCMYSVFGNAGSLYRFNLRTGTCQQIILQDLGVTTGAFAFVVKGKLYVAGGNNGTFSSSTDKVWMIDLDAYPL